MADVLDLPFDQYQRYELVHALLESVRAPGETFHVLDVGGRTALLRQFLPDDRVDLVDVDPSDAEGLVLGSGALLPFADDAFDVVAAFDTLEHVPPALREAFVAECARVSKRYVMLAGPYDSPRVAEAEELLLDFLRRRLQWEHRYLKEHRDNGLPSMEATIAGFEAAGARVATFGHGALDRWLALMVIELYVEHEALLREIAPRIYRLYNEHLFRTDHGDDVYRHAVVAVMGDAPVPSLERTFGPAGPVPAEATRAFLEIGQEFARYDALRDTYQPEMERLHQVVADVEKDLAEHKQSLATVEDDRAQTKESLAAVTADRDESKRTIEALSAELERERTEGAKVVAEKDREIAAQREMIEELRRLHEAGNQEIEARGAALEHLREEAATIHANLHEALASVRAKDEHEVRLRGDLQAKDEREQRLRGDLAEALAGTEDRAVREQLLAASPLSLEEELALLIDARDRRLRERDEARDQIVALAAELAREQHRAAELLRHADTVGARLWRVVTLRTLGPELRGE